MKTSWFRHGRDHRTRRTPAHQRFPGRSLAIGLCGLLAWLAGISGPAAAEPPLWTDIEFVEPLPPRVYTGIPVEELSRKYGELPEPASGAWAYAYPPYGPYPYYYRPWYTYPPAYWTYRPWYTYPPAARRYRPRYRFRYDFDRGWNRYDVTRERGYHRSPPEFGRGYPYTY